MNASAQLLYHRAVAIQAAFSQIMGHITGAKSTVLYPLGWAIGLLIAGLIMLVCFAKPDLWLVQTLTALIVVGFVVYIVGWFIFAFKDPDALRSERYQLSKMAIEKTLQGDTLKGFAEAQIVDETVMKALPQMASPPSKEAGA